MESATGADLSAVRVHRDGRADALNRSHDSLALTHGHDIYVRGGHHAPQTASGRVLLAHELTHVAQQSADSAAPAVQHMKPVVPGGLGNLQRRLGTKPTPGDPASIEILQRLGTYAGRPLEAELRAPKELLRLVKSWVYDPGAANRREQSEVLYQQLKIVDVFLRRTTPNVDLSQIRNACRAWIRDNGIAADDGVGQIRLLMVRRIEQAAIDENPLNPRRVGGAEAPATGGLLERFKRSRVPRVPVSAGLRAGLSAAAVSAIDPTVFNFRTGLLDDRGQLRGDLLPVTRSWRYHLEPAVLRESSGRLYARLKTVTAELSSSSTHSAAADWNGVAVAAAGWTNAYDRLPEAERPGAPDREFVEALRQLAMLELRPAGQIAPEADRWR